MRLALGLAVLGVVTVAPTARADTTCVLGGPTPSFSAFRLVLPHGSSFLDLRIDTARPTAVAGSRASWHLAEGVALLTARGRLVAARVVTSGSSPRRVVVEANGQRVDTEVIGPDAPFQHLTGSTVPAVAPGTYYAVGFGSDGDPQPPNLYWTADVQVSGDVSCTPVGRGEVFDADQTSFHGGTQVSAYGPGLGQDVQLTTSTRRRMTFGLLDAAVQGAGTAQLDYTLPTSHGTVSNQIVPFTAGPGRSRFTASFAGPFPMVVVAGVSFDP